jgi:Transposase
VIFYEMCIDNKAVEGFNNKAKVVGHRCYGLRTVKTYITAQYNYLGKLPEPDLLQYFLLGSANATH